MAGNTDLFEIMQTMRAMRRLKPDPVPDELIGKILQAGTCAPNGGNTQRWRFLVIKDRKIKQGVQVWYKKAFDEVVGGLDGLGDGPAERETTALETVMAAVGLHLGGDGRGEHERDRVRGTGRAERTLA